jgi:spore coat protein CotH
MGFKKPYVRGTLRVGDLATEVGVRLKGSSTFDELDRKPSLKLAFDAFTPGHRFLGMEHLTLNAMKFDRSMMREAIAYHVFDELDVPAPRQAYTTVTINGEPYGLYSMIETLDNEWLHRVLPEDDDGNLYDTNLLFADLNSAGLPNFSLQEGDPETADADLAQLLHDLDGGKIFDVLQSRFDFESVMNFLAVDLAGPNYDGYSRNTNNYLLYHATKTDRWYMVPWGQDTAFSGGGPVYGGVRARLTTACLGNSDCKTSLEQHIDNLLAVWEDGLYDWAAAQAAMVGPICEADTRKYEKTCEQEKQLEQLQRRPDEVRTFVP